MINTCVKVGKIFKICQLVANTFNVHLCKNYQICEKFPFGSICVHSQVKFNAPSISEWKM